jgi:aminoglycoside 3-N-acetyltransferase
VSRTSLDRGDIAAAFRACGIAAGDCLMLHADAMAAAQMAPSGREAKLDAVLDGILDALQPEGTLVMPAFSYSFTKGLDFDPAESVTGMGLLAERFRQRPGTLRSLHPIFSVTASGGLADELVSTAIDDCFGPHSLFGALARANAWLACLACPFSLTFTHYVEQQAAVDYRYFKMFSGRIAGGAPTQCRYFVRDLTRNSQIDLRRLQQRLGETGKLASVDIGRVKLLAVRALDFEQAALALLKEDPVSLIREGAAVR